VSAKPEFGEHRTIRGIEVVAVAVEDRTGPSCCDGCEFHALSGYEEPCSSCFPTLIDYVWMTPINALAHRLTGETS
jgi:hypothetical protein